MQNQPPGRALHLQRRNEDIAVCRYPDTEIIISGETDFGPAGERILKQD